MILLSTKQNVLNTEVRKIDNDFIWQKKSIKVWSVVKVVQNTVRIKLVLDATKLWGTLSNCYISKKE